MQSVAESTHYTMQHLMPPYKNGYPRYHRLDFIIPEANSQMDDASDSNIQKLCELADDYIRKNMTELLKICEILK